MHWSDCESSNAHAHGGVCVCVCVCVCKGWSDCESCIAIQPGPTTDAGGGAIAIQPGPTTDAGGGGVGAIGVQPGPHDDAPSRGGARDAQIQPWTADPTQGGGGGDRKAGPLYGRARAQKAHWLIRPWGAPADWGQSPSPP